MKVQGYQTDKIVPLSNEDYYYYLINEINKAKHRVFCSIFIINSLINDDLELKVRSLIKALAYAKYRNVDVRILFGNSKTNAIRTGNETTAEYMKVLGISTKQYEPSFRKSLHSKYVIIDDYLSIIGSHNWSHNAFCMNLEDSIAVYSNEINTVLSDEFDKLWRASKEMEGQE